MQSWFSLQHLPFTQKPWQCWKKKLWNLETWMGIWINHRWAQLHLSPCIRAKRHDQAGRSHLKWCSWQLSTSVISVQCRCLAMTGTLWLPALSKNCCLSYSLAFFSSDSSPYSFPAILHVWIPQAVLSEVPANSSQCRSMGWCWKPRTGACAVFDRLNCHVCGSNTDWGSSIRPSPAERGKHIWL